MKSLGASEHNIHTYIHTAHYKLSLQMDNHSDYTLEHQTFHV